MATVGSVTDIYRIVGLAGRGVVTAGPDGGDETYEPFLVDLVLHATSEIDLAVAAQAAAEALAWPHSSLLARSEGVAQAVRDAVEVEAVEVTLHRPEATLGVPVLDVELSIRRPAAVPAAVAEVVEVAEVVPAAAPLPVEPEPVEPEPDAEPEPVLAVPALDAIELPAPLPVPVPVVEPVPVLPSLAAAEPDDDLPPADLDATTVRADRALLAADVPSDDDDEPIVPPTAMQPRRPSQDSPVPALLVLSGRGGSAQVELAGAVRGLGAAAGLEITGVSPLARTTTGGGDLHSAVISVRSTLGPGDLAETAALVAAGRTGVEIELLTVGDLLGVHDGVELPLPGVASSATVLVPWGQLDPTAVLPGLGGGPVVVLAETAPDRESVRWLALDWLE